jgi:phage/plasmid-like protein (TIGR03299 family)
MPAYFDTGFSVRKPMWHGLGNVLDEYPETWDDARRLAGLEWEPELRPIVEIRCGTCQHVLDSADIEVGVCSKCLSTDTKIGLVEGGEQRVIRNDTGLHLGSVSKQFSLVTHAEMGEVMEALIDSDSALKFETAGSVRDGRQVWALAYLDEPEQIAGDDSPTYPYLAILNSHDGTGAMKVVNTSVRVVCWNTYNAASLEGDRTGRQYTFRHVGKVSERIEEAKEAIKGLRVEQRNWIETANRLASFRIDRTAVDNFVYLTIPEPPADVTSDRVKNNIERDRDTLRTIISGRQNDAHRGTVLGLVDAGIEYLDHGRRFRNRETLMNRTMLRPEPLKARVLANALEVAGASL